MMSKFNSYLNFPTPQPRKLPKSEILWGCESGGSPHFPKDFESIKTRHYSNEPKPLEAFGKAVIGAMDRVWIVDGYFFVPDEKRGSAPETRIFAILDWLHPNLVACDIRILTGQHKEITEEMLQLFQEREKEINASRARQTKRCSIQVNTHLAQSFDYIHDRFAIVDDELWHFGATVGGFHARVNAASRGWCATSSGAIAFFNLAWEQCGGK